MLRLLTALALTVAFGAPAAADGLRNGTELLMTGGVTTSGGSAGRGPPDFGFTPWGVAGGACDRGEVSYARQRFDTQDAGAALGLGKGFTFNQDVFGVKVVVLGDAVYDQDRWLPQVAVGAQYKKNDQGPIIAAVGGLDDEGVDYYVAATKLLLDKSLLVSGTVRMTKANQTGLLGFGGPNGDDHEPEFEGSVAWLASKRLAFGAEYRTKSGNLAFAREDDVLDVFAAFAVNKNLSITAAYVDLGDIATFKDQRGVYLSLQAGF